MRTSIALALAAAKLAASHTTFQSFVIDGKDQGQHFAVQTPSNGNNPIKDVTSTSLICNGGKATSDFVEIAAGSEITMQWHHNDGASTSGDSDEPIAASHKGPVMVYVAPAESKGEGDVWVKVYEDGFTNGKWGVDNFIANKGAVTITLPDLAAGEYLIRPEIIALHEANNKGSAQFYNGCGQIKVTGGSTKLPSGVDMTKVYSADDAGVLVNIYSGLTSYSIPGPKVWDGASSGTSPSTPTSSKAPVSSAPVATSAPVVSAKPTATPAATPSPVESKPPTQTSAPAAPAASSGAGNGSALPETFTLEQFISWLSQYTSGPKSRRAHARAF
jgi:cellulase